MSENLKYFQVTTQNSVPFINRSAYNSGRNSSTDVSICQHVQMFSFTAQCSPSCSTTRAGSSDTSGSNTRVNTVDYTVYSKYLCLYQQQQQQQQKLSQQYQKYKYSSSISKDSSGPDGTGNCTVSVTSSCSLLLVLWYKSNIQNLTYKTLKHSRQNWLQVFENKSTHSGAELSLFVKWNLLSVDKSAIRCYRSVPLKCREV